ncbi:hypothetical protein AOLI_G00223520 [Acnodon oligacanthus]
MLIWRDTRGSVIRPRCRSTMRNTGTVELPRLDLPAVLFLFISVIPERQQSASALKPPWPSPAINKPTNKPGRNTASTSAATRRSRAALAPRNTAINPRRAAEAARARAQLFSSVTFQQDPAHAVQGEEHALLHDHPALLRAPAPVRLCSPRLRVLAHRGSSADVELALSVRFPPPDIPARPKARVLRSHSLRRPEREASRSAVWGGKSAALAPAGLVAARAG